jgi:lysophospholipase L1-like esterase
METAVLARSRGAWLVDRLHFRRFLRPWVLGLVVLFLLLAAEVAVRVVDARRGYSPHARNAWYWLFEQDPFLGYRGRPLAEAWIDPPGLPLNADHVRHNAEGFRDRRSLAEIAALPHRKLVMCVGDANTYGLTAGSEERTYPAVLEKELRARSGDPGWVVFNAGLPGYTTHEILELVKLRLLKLHPDVVLSMSLRNDHEQVTIFLDEKLDYDQYPLRMAPLSATPLTDFFMRSALVGRLAQRWRARYVDDLGGRWPMTAYGEATPRGRQLYFDNVALLAALCRRAGVRLMLADQPIHYSTCSYGPSLIDSVEAMRRELRATAELAGVPLLAAHEGFNWDGVEVRGDLLLASNESVLGPLGYERLARMLAPQVLAEYARSRPSPSTTGARPGD